ncbi:DUF5753 domain-containing protein [Nocardiopsis sp. NPDC049922]|uniref:DUF5753 domain-containing protein n=1 Tax=Nocardiopsis sp. NPDC049922 TaxID=3155157 RepID=UPI00340EA879
MQNSSDSNNEQNTSAKYAESVYTEWTQKEQGGLRKLQESYIPLYERTQRFRKYMPDIIPGFFQTPAYANSLLATITEFRGIPNEVEPAAEARVRRSRIIHQKDRTFEIVLEESVLRYRMGNNETMAEQFEHLLTMSSLPHVSLGVIPSSAPRSMWPVEGFSIYDDTLVQSELLAAEINIEAPAEIATYIKAFDRLQELAVHGDEARAVITSAIEALD